MKGYDTKKEKETVESHDRSCHEGTCHKKETVESHDSSCHEGNDIEKKRKLWRAMIVAVMKGLA